MQTVNHTTDLLRYDLEALKNNRNANHGRTYQQCSLSVMDTIADPNISFDEDGVCNYYKEYLSAEHDQVLKGEAGQRKIESIVNKIIESGKGKPYDCITGVSGGVDSTYLAYLAKQWGLRPLIVHFDNGWNSELAVKNIENIISKLGFDLFTLVVDWEEFRDLQLAYFKASVVDIEAITDHAIIATLHRLSHKYGIKYILSGSNVVTEATLPSHWIWNKSDHVNLLDIHKRFGTKKLKTFPVYTRKLKKMSQMKGVEVVSPLNYVDYNKSLVKQTITDKLDWRDYGGKHYESVFTRFYQGYILPVKFNIDKRKAHLSNLIFSGQIDKQQAIDELNENIYAVNNLKEDYDFVIKKLGFSDEAFHDWLLQPRKEHYDYEIDRSVWDKYFFLKPFKGLRQALK